MHQTPGARLRDAASSNPQPQQAAGGVRTHLDEPDQPIAPERRKPWFQSVNTTAPTTRQRPGYRPTRFQPHFRQVELEDALPEAFVSSGLDGSDPRFAEVDEYFAGADAYEGEVEYLPLRPGGHWILASAKASAPEAPSSEENNRHIPSSEPLR